MKPLLFLDVDGVLALYPPRKDSVRVAFDGMAVHVDPGLRARVDRLRAAFEVVWCTAWRGAAHGQFREHLGLPRESWPYVDYAGCKLPYLVRFAKGRPWAWIDDDAEYEYHELGDAWRDLPGSLVLVPRAKVGMTDGHVDRLLEFAAKCGSDADEPTTASGSVKGVDAPRLHIFDADGTLVRSFLREGGEKADFDKVEFLPGRAEALKRLAWEGHTSVIASNQGGVAFGYQTLPQVVSKMTTIARRLEVPCACIRLGVHSAVDSTCEPLDTANIDAGRFLPGLYLSLHHPKGKLDEWVCSPEDDWRKPGGGMLRQAMLDHGFDAECTIFVGDMDTDREAAAAAGVEYRDAEEFFA